MTDKFFQQQLAGVCANRIPPNLCRDDHFGSVYPLAFPQDVIFITRLDGQIEEVNPVCFELLHIPIIFISARDEAFDKVQAFANGGVDYITKPYH